MEGESMSEWKELRAQDFCFYVTDGTHDSPKRRTKGYYLLTSKHIGKDTLDFESAYKISEDDYLKIIERSKVEQYDILYSMIGTIGNVHIVKENKVDFAVKNMGIFKFNGNYLHSLWMYYWLKSTKATEYIKSRLSGSTQQYITLSSLRDFPISIPEIDIMRLITGILSSLDAKIETNNKLNEKLEEMAQAIFKLWLDGCEETVQIDDLSLNITDYSKLNKDKVILINSSDVTNGFFDHHNYSDNNKLKGHFKKRFSKGDILYSQVRPRNRHWAYCYFDAEDYIASTQLMVIRNNPEKVSSLLLYQYLISDRVWNEFTLKTETRSGTFPQGNYEDLSKICVPYKKDNEKISKTLEHIYNIIYNRYDENQRLASLRDTLLPRLMSGELTV